MKKHVWCLLGFCFFLGACETESEAWMPDEKPDDFNFSLHFGYGAQNELNTFEDTFTKDLIEDGQVTTEMVLTDEEMERIYTNMREADVLGVSDNTEGSTCSDPHHSYQLVLQADGEEFRDSWNTSCETEATTRWESFMDFLVSDIIEPRPEYQALPEPTGGYD
ncbi:hypothetical protein [Alteribacter natronophilus]|uniref:hypothetical protein n=1 Tax=Alteribacter natronophilus TaxID=2583810 RepID=UPI00110D25D0|nr:hypothetical protein [Alteribacter natronophilus]TMW72829.1 hypothetical protein FGB90_00510 [Alteribacter natronophilus]